MVIVTHLPTEVWLLMATDSSLFVLVTRDGAKFEVPLKVIRLLRTLDNMLGGKIMSQDGRTVKMLLLCRSWL